MKPLLAGFRVFAVALLAAVGAPLAWAQDEGEAPAPELVWIRVEGQIDTGTLSLVRRAVDRAAATNGRLVVELDTPGGEVELMWRIAGALQDAAEEGVTTAAWVNDSALSAGALIAMACDRLYMRERASIGSAAAITIGPTGVAPVAQDPEVREKFYSSFRSRFRAVAEAKGRSAAVAEAMVDAEVEVSLVRVEGELMLLTGRERDDRSAAGEIVQLERTIVRRGELLNLTGVEALELGFADGLSETANEVVERLGAVGEPRVFLERQRSEDLAALLDSLAPLLFIVGLVLAFIELKVPGFGLPGIGSVACFAALLFGRYLTGLADVPQIVLVVAGIALVAVELFLVPGTLWAGVTGGILLFTGLVWSTVGAGLEFGDPFERGLAIDRAFDLVVWSAIAAGVMFALSRLLPKSSLFERLAVAPSGAVGPLAGPADALPAGSTGGGLVGARGVAHTALRPVGKVRLDGTEAMREASIPGGAIEPGTRVVVVEEAPGGRLVVEPAPEEAQP